MLAHNLARLSGALDQRLVDVATKLSGMAANPASARGSNDAIMQMEGVADVLRLTARTTESIARHGGGDEAIRAATAIRSAGRTLSSPSMHQGDLRLPMTDALKDVLDARISALKLTHAPWN